MEEELLSFSSFQTNEDPSSIINSLTKVIPQNELFLDLSIDLFRSSRLQLKTLLEAMTIKMDQSSETFDQFLNITENKLVSLSSGPLQKSTNTINSLDRQISTNVQKNKRNVQMFSQKQKEIVAIGQNQHFIQLIKLFVKQDELALNKLLHDSDIPRQIMLAKSLASILYFQRHDELLFKEWDELISQFLNEFENEHLLQFRQAASLQDARNHCEVLHEFNEAFSCVKVFINNLPLFLPKENTLFTFFDSKLSFEFDQDMEDEVFDEISQYFQQLLSDFTTVWSDTILKIFPNPILCVEKFVERLFIELLQNFVDRTSENAAKHSVIAYLKIFSKIYQEALYFSNQIYYQIYLNKSNSFQDSFVARYLDEVFLGYFGKICKTEKSYLSDFFVFLQRKEGNLDPILVNRIAKVIVSGFKGLEDCKYCNSFENTLIGLNLFTESLDRISSFGLESYDEIRNEFFQIVADELFFKFFFEQPQLLKDLLVVWKVLLRIEKEYFGSEKFTILYERIQLLIQQSISTELAEWSKVTVDKVWAMDSVEGKFDDEVKIYFKKSCDILIFDDDLLNQFIKLLHKLVIKQIIEKILKEKYDLKGGQLLEVKLKAFAKVLNSIGSTASTTDSVDFLTCISDLFSSNSNSINELLLKEPFSLMPKEIIRSLVSRRQDSVKVA